MTSHANLFWTPISQNVFETQVVIFSWAPRQETGVECGAENCPQSPFFRRKFFQSFGISHVNFIVSRYVLLPVFSKLHNISRNLMTLFLFSSTSLFPQNLYGKKFWLFFWQKIFSFRYVTSNNFMLSLQECLHFQAQFLKLYLFEHAYFSCHFLWFRHKKFVSII